MPNLSLSSKFKVSNNILTPNDIRTFFLLGVKTVSSTGEELSDEVIQKYIDISIRELEKVICIKLRREIIKERLDFTHSNFVQWGYLKTTYQVVCPKSLTGYLATQRHISYPKEWLCTRIVSDNQSFSRNFYLVPNTTNFSSNSLLYSQLFDGRFATFWRNYGYNDIPNYWEVEYLTGFDKLPDDLFNFIGKLTTLQLLPIISDLITRIPGSSNMSISLDGLSQSISSVVNSTSGVYGPRMTQLAKELDSQLTKLRDYYRGLSFISI